MAPGASVHVQRSPGRSQLTVLAAAPAEIERATMDERIFGFNKVVIDTVYDVICLLYPVTGSERDFARFYVLETVARVPYFAYLSADNELHHLLIMESLGGNSSAVDRTLAQTMAFFYYWYVTVVYSFSEPAAYHLSELIEDHAFNTYDGFLRDHGPKLKGMPVPDIARKYYERDDPFLFDQFCTVKEPDGGEFTSRSRPPLESLYDVFVNIRNDEKEHWKTLCNLVQLDDTQGFPVQSTEPAPPQLAAP
ncbi:ubiquinol:oxygen oxidoreductase [Aureococcus anophagefferens]|nr:ubiquinol:oxygen oxidoreductase [Aureococcus anophagefferens]